MVFAVFNIRGKGFQTNLEPTVPLETVPCTRWKVDEYWPSAQFQGVAPPLLVFFVSRLSVKSTKLWDVHACLGCYNAYFCSSLFSGMVHLPSARDCHGEYLVSRLFIPIAATSHGHSIRQKGSNRTKPIKIHQHPPKSIKILVTHF